MYPLYDKICVRKDAQEERKSAGGIVIPATAGVEASKTQAMTGTVVAIGIGRLSEDGKITALKVNIGDRVAFPSYSGIEIPHNGETHVLVSESNVFAVLQRSE